MARLMYLFFDVETSGFVLKDLPHDHPQQAHLVELGAILCDESGVERASVSMIVRPHGWTIPPAVAAIHGITQEIAEQFGVDVEHVVTTFAHLLGNATKALAFNVAFDRDVMSLELLRMGEVRPVEWPPNVEIVCVMEAARSVLNLAPTKKMLRAGYTGPKAPKLSEAYLRLFDEELIGAHSALADARAAKRIWFRLQGLGEPGRSDTYIGHGGSGGLT